MNEPGKLRSALAVIMAAAILASSMPIASVRAEMVPTDRVVDRVEIDAKRAEIATFFMRAEVSGRIAKMGVTQQEADARVAGMTDAEVLQVAEKIQQLPAGQALDSGSLVVILLLIIILVLVI